MLTERAAATRPATPAPEATAPKRNANERRQKLAPLRQEAAKLERLIERIQAAIAEIDGKLADPKSYVNGIDLETLGKKKAEYLEAVEKAEDQWLHSLEAIDKIERA